MCLGLAAALFLRALIENIVILGLMRLTARAFCAVDGVKKQWKWIDDIPSDTTPLMASTKIAFMFLYIASL